MDCGFSVREAVTQRYSVRTYDRRPVEAELREKLLAYGKEISNPLGPAMRLQLIEKETAPNGEKLGTYGIIKGTNLYVGVTIPEDEHAMEALGYAFEQFVLYATSLGLGTCWLGGTFNRSAFAAAMEIRDEELFPILSPIGYPAEKKSFSEKLMRRTIGADKREPWEKRFFKGDFSAPLHEEEAGDFRVPLEMLRLAPSAVNKQPWRVVVDGNRVHFFEKRIAGSGKIDMQRIDVGIAICHFHLVAEEQGLHGRITRTIPDFAVPADLVYIASWMKD